MAKKHTDDDFVHPEPPPVRFVIPRGFEAHYGDGMPVAADQYVEPIIRTAEGFGSAGVVKAGYHDWTFETHAESAGLGEVVAYRVCHRGDPARFGPEERF